MVRDWRKQANAFHHLQQTAGQAPPAPAAAETPAPSNPFVCYFCGSSEHVEAMEQVFLHKPCKGLLKSALMRAGGDG